MERSDEMASWASRSSDGARGDREMHVASRMMGTLSTGGQRGDGLIASDILARKTTTDSFSRQSSKTDQRTGFRHVQNGLGSNWALLKFATKKIIRGGSCLFRCTV